jgi:hypothetical protein
MASVTRAGTKGPRRPSVRRFSSAILLAVLVSALSVVPAGAAKQVAGVDLVGYLKRPIAAPPATGSYSPYFMDAVNRRLYTVYVSGTTHIVEFDLDAQPVPKMLRDVDLGVKLAAKARPPSVSVDSAHRRAYILNISDQGLGGVQILDLKTLKLGALHTMAELGAPGIQPVGLTYSPADKRIYVVGQLTGHNANDFDPTGARVVTPAAAVALDSRVKSIEWIRPIAECQELMNTFGEGTLVARSQHQAALYFACTRPGEKPGQSGVVRLWIKPKADQSAANDFPVDFFPVSGNYASGSGISGVAAFDYASERFYLLSQSVDTPGAWVLDGRLSAWVGFIGAGDSFDRGLGLDQGNGHVYIKSGHDGKLIVADGRATPVPQGVKVAYDPHEGTYPVDPVTHRAFVWTEVQEKGLAPHGEIGVLLDRTPQADSLQPPDYDGLTQDVAEGPGVATDFSGDTNGFGVRGVLVGGLGGVLSGIGLGDADTANVRKGDRGLTAARLPSLDLRPVGASGTAQPLVSDTNTEAELDEAGVTEWPWPPASCLDGNGQSVGTTTSGPGGQASVSCDLAKARAEGSALFQGFDAQGISVASSSLQSRIYRDPKRGLVTESVSSARGVELSAPSGASVSIGEIRATATTVAHGRPGSAKATWERVLSEVQVLDEKGKPVEQIGHCSSSAEQDDCQALVDEINKLLHMKVQLSLPQAQVIATPKGAFAGVQQSDGDYYNGQTALGQGSTFAAEAASRAVPALQAVVYNDSAEKSRSVVQFAALQASSIYTNRKESAPVPPTDPTGDDNLPATNGSSAGTAGAGSSGSIAGGAAAIPAGGASAPGSGASAPLETAAQSVPDAVLAFFTRTPKDALLFAGVWLIFGGAGMGLVRRRRLLRVLDEGLA